MSISKQALSFYEITEEEFYNWCRENHKSNYKKSVQKEFFKKLIQGKLIKDQNGKIVEKE